jgi:hypothetical protein
MASQFIFISYFKYQRLNVSFFPFLFVEILMGEKWLLYLARVISLCHIKTKWVKKLSELFPFVT